MNSFDIWDTLLARRTMRDEIYWKMREGKTFEEAAAFELSNLIPITENVAKVNPDDILVSDYGDGTVKWEHFLYNALLKVCGLSNHITVTPGGKYDGTIWDSLPQKPVMHTGDNYRADFESPEQHGIKGQHIVLSPFTEAEQFMADNSFPILARACREARLKTYNPAYRGIELLQVNYNFPVLFLASIMLNRRYPTGDLCMSARDCFMWQRLMQRLFHRGEYWYTSCIARTSNFDQNYKRYIESFSNPILVDLCGSGLSFAELRRHLGYDIPCVLMYKPNTSPDKTIESLVYDNPVMRLEQANFAPHQKTQRMNDDLRPVFINRSSHDWTTDPYVKAQLNAFNMAMFSMDYYDLSEELKASDEQCSKVMRFLLPQYYNFRDDVEPLRILAVNDDKEPDGDTVQPVAHIQAPPVPSPQSTGGPLSDVTILITSFLRPGYLSDCLAGIKNNLPECSVIVVDDGDMQGQGIISMPFDSGLSAKRNRGVAATTTKYLLMGSDDFDFSTVEARTGIEKMVSVLEADHSIDVAGGHVNGERYEGNLIVAPGQYIAQHHVDPDLSGVTPVDLVVNYFVARTESIHPYPWDERMKIGGEHGDWFLTLKDAGKKVVAVTGVNITTAPYNPSKQDPRYGGFRGRAKDLGHKIFLRKRGVTEFYGDVHPEPLKLPKFMVAIVACHKNQHKVNALRKTWLPSLYKIDYKIFYGRGATRDPLPDEVFLDVDDGYVALPSKMKAIYQWVLERGYEYVYKVDDDVYVEIPRLIPCGWEKHDYSGRINAGGPIPWASGACYWLSKKAMQIVANAPLTEDTAEDRWVATALYKEGIHLHNEMKYNLVISSPPDWRTAISACLCTETITMDALAKGFENPVDAPVSAKIVPNPQNAPQTQVPPLRLTTASINWQKGFLEKKVQDLFQRFRYVVATVPNSAHYKQLCRIYPDHLEEMVDTPEGRRVIFIVEK